MQFRRNGQRDERRRRALMDDRAGESGKQQATEDKASPGCLSTRTYSKSAVDERRVRVIDVVPLYAVHVALLYATVLVVAAGLLTLDYYGSKSLRWADLSRVDSLGTYLTAGTLFAGVLLAGLIYRIRRHRLDDYRGRYRCWLWFAALLLMASMDSMLDFRNDVAIGLESATKLRFFGQTGGWWAVVWCFGYGAMALRAAIEVRESIGTLVVATLSGVLLLSGVALELDLVRLPASVPAELILHAVRLVGVGLLLASLVQYARYVWLDAQGLIARSASRSVESEEEVAAKPKTRRSRTAAKKPAEKIEEESDEQEEETQPRRSWFGFGRKKVVEEDAEQESAKPATAKSRKAQPVEDEETTEVKPKHSWFSWGSKRADEAEAEQEATQPAATKSRASRTKVEEEPAEEKPKRGWFSFGRKSNDEESTEEPVKPAKSKPAPAQPKIAAETTGDADDAAEAPPKKSWFSWGSNKKEAEPESLDGAMAEENRTTMSPRIKTRPKATAPPQEEPKPKPEPPTITGKYNQPVEADENSEEDEEILRLEAKPDHLLSKAERRRLKKLKRRSAA